MHYLKDAFGKNGIIFGFAANKFLTGMLFALCLLFSVDASAENVLRMSTTTSTENSGLLAVLNPPFESKNNVRLDVIGVGTGKALRLGKNGDVDVVFAHAPLAEQIFVDEGYGVDRRAVMHNDFVIVGPVSDPAGIKASSTAVGAFRKFSEGKGVFVSRGDESGTNEKRESTLADSGF